MIPKWAFALGFGGIILFLIGVQLILAPPSVFRFSSNATEESTSGSDTAALQSHFPESAFSNTDLGEVVLSKQMEVNQFFNTTLFPSEQLNIRVLKSLYSQKKGTTISPLISVYEFFPTRDTTIDHAYLSLKGFFAESLKDSVEAEVNETNTYGEHSFYINLGNQEKTVYLVVAHKNELLGFEYPRASHESVKKVFQTYFGTVPDAL
ncbi:MAG: hypothetical protein WCJ84_01160 [Candidatus Peregrinibacteria bacterium]